MTVFDRKNKNKTKLKTNWRISEGETKITQDFSFSTSIRSSNESWLQKTISSCAMDVFHRRSGFPY